MNSSTKIDTQRIKMTIQWIQLCVALSFLLSWHGIMINGNIISPQSSANFPQRRQWINFVHILRRNMRSNIFRALFIERGVFWILKLNKQFQSVTKENKRKTEKRKKEWDRKNNDQNLHCKKWVLCFHSQSPLIRSNTGSSQNLCSFKHVLFNLIPSKSEHIYLDCVLK